MTHIPFTGQTVRLNPTSDLYQLLSNQEWSGISATCPICAAPYGHRTHQPACWLNNALRSQPVNISPATQKLNLSTEERTADALERIADCLTYQTLLSAHFDVSYLSDRYQALDRIRERLNDVLERVIDPCIEIASILPK